MRVKKESLILGEVLDYLETLPHCFAWRNNTGGGKVNGFQLRWGFPGSADIIGVLAPAGTFLAVETKTVRGRLSPAQERFREAITSAGGIYIVARSVADVRVLSVTRDAFLKPITKPTRRVFSGATPG